MEKEKPRPKRTRRSRQNDSKPTKSGIITITNEENSDEIFNLEPIENEPISLEAGSSSGVTDVLTANENPANDQCEPPSARGSPGITGVPLAVGEGTSTQSPKGSTKRRQFSVNFKLQIINQAKKSSNREAARKNSLDESVVRDWRKNEKKLLETADGQKWIHIPKSYEKTGFKPKRFRVSNERKAPHENLEEVLYKWIVDRRSNSKQVTRKSIQEKARKIFLELGSESQSFVASDGWCSNFMKRYKLSTRQKTHQSQRLPSDTDPKIVKFFHYLRKYFATHSLPKGQAVAMDETCVFLENVSNKTVSVMGM